MQYQVQITTRTGQVKFQKDAITGKARAFETRDRAQKAADSAHALARCDWKTEGYRAAALAGGGTREVARRARQIAKGAV